jgi:prepilin-type N-terminal cleavage/methylation domain-containing protein
MKISSRVSFSKSQAFSLIEILMVTALITVLMSLVMPAMSSIRGGQNVTRVSSDIATTLEQARSYAMANNTYVFVGFSEVDGIQAESARPQQSGSGRLLVAVAASKDGTRGYDLTSPASSWTGAANLSPLGRLQRFDGVHLADVVPIPTPGMESVAASAQLGQVTVPTTFDWPIGSGQKVCTFSRVIQFDPQGSAAIPSGSGLSRWLEVALRPAHGNRLDAASPNFAALQLEGVTGAVKLFRP